MGVGMGWVALWALYEEQDERSKPCLRVGTRCNLTPQGQAGDSGPETRREQGASVCQAHSALVALPSSSILHSHPHTCRPATAKPPMSEADFASLPRFDAHTFQPPAWALDRKPLWDLDKNGESSTSAARRSQTPAATDEAESDEEGEVWQDAEQGDDEITDPWDAAFTTAELRARLHRDQASLG